MDTILTLVNKGNDFLWSFLLLILLCGTGIYYTIRLKFIQVRKFGEGCKHVFGHFSLNGEKHEKGEMSPFQSIMTAIAAQVGTGNLAGAATALFGGGPGAIFWMWLSAFFGMATIYSEAVLAQTYKTEVNGEVTGGPVYYIKAAFKGNFHSVCYLYCFSTWVYGQYGTVQLDRCCVYRGISGIWNQYSADHDRSCAGSTGRIHFHWWNQTSGSCGREGCASYGRRLHCRKPDSDWSSYQSRADSIYDDHQGRV